MKELINFTIDGEEINSLSLKDVLEGLGLLYDKEKNIYWIHADDITLEKPVNVEFVDDFGVEEHTYKVTETYCDSLQPLTVLGCRQELENVDIWKEDNVFPGKHIIINNKEFVITDLIMRLKEDNTTKIQEMTTITGEIQEVILDEDLNKNDIEYFYNAIEFNIEKINENKAEQLEIKREDIKKYV